MRSGKKITVTKEAILSWLVTNGQGFSCHANHLDPPGLYIPVIRSHGRWLAIYSRIGPSLINTKLDLSLTCWIPSEVFWTNVCSAFIRCQTFKCGSYWVVANDCCVLVDAITPTWCEVCAMSSRLLIGWAAFLTVRKAARLAVYVETQTRMQNQ